MLGIIQQVQSPLYSSQVLTTNIHTNMYSMYTHSYMYKHNHTHAFIFIHIYMHTHIIHTLIYIYCLVIIFTIIINNK